MSKRLNRKHISLAIIVVGIILLWLSRNSWLSILPPASDKVNFIPNLESLVNTAIAIFGVVVSYFTWVVNREKKKQRDWIEEAPIQPVALNELTERNLLGGPIKWIDRKAASVKDLRIHGNIALTGRMKLGKTREAIELIRQAITENLVSPNRIFVISPLAFFLNKAKIQETLEHAFNPEMPILIFIDDLPFHYPSAHLEILTEIIKVLHSYKELYVVVTARLDQLTDAHNTWLKETGFFEIRLPDLNTNQIGELVDSAAESLGLQLLDTAREAFIKEMDGTPELTLIGLRRLQARGLTQISEEVASTVTQESLIESWAEVRRYIQKRNPIAKYLFIALGTLHTAKRTPYSEVVLEFASFLWKNEEKTWKIIVRKQELKSALEYLANFNIANINGKLIYPDIAVEGLVKTNDIDFKLTPFFLHYRLIPKTLNLQEAQEYVLSKLPYFINQNKLLNRQELDALGNYQKLQLPNDAQILIIRSLEKEFLKSTRISIVSAVAPWLLVFILGVLGLIYYLPTSNIIAIFWLYVLLFGIVGARRGWAKELLVSFSVILALGINHVLRRYIPIAQSLPETDVSLFWVRTIILLVLVYFGYQTVKSIPELAAKAVRERLQDTLFGANLGAINGYLVAGSVLYYVHITDYAFPTIISKTTDPKLLQAINQMMLYMPPQLLGEPGIYFALIVAFVFVLVVYI